MGLFGGDSYLFFVVLGSEALCGIDGKISGIEKIWGWLFEVTLRRLSVLSEEISEAPGVGEREKPR